MIRKVILGFIVALMYANIANAQTPPVASANNKLQWGQPAQDLSTASAYTYKWYLDGSATGTSFTGVTCTGTGPYQCIVMFPPVSQGNHIIKISASNAAGESPLSDPFSFTFVGKPLQPTNLQIVP